ncbi:MAG: hypothetical protein OXN97_08405 [Bryobacterales bacterium]|nr:hypothetical protein [Bryobacterales bacterium]
MKYGRCADPRISPTPIRPITEAMTWFRVACLSAMLSTVRVLGSAPGEWISKRSENIDRRVLLPRIE